MNCTECGAPLDLEDSFSDLMDELPTMCPPCKGVSDAEDMNDLKVKDL